jgi:hypothetical protein
MIRISAKSWCDPRDGHQHIQCIGVMTADVRDDAGACCVFQESVLQSYP